jgi:redox-sensing transcriptional repressor
LQIVALFDEDPAKIGQVYGERPVLPVSKLTDLAQRLHIQMGIITVPACSAQQVADMMVAGGVRVIWNFAPCALAAPEYVLVKNEDLASELAMLSHHISQRALREARFRQIHKITLIPIHRSGGPCGRRMGVENSIHNHIIL